MGERGDLQQGRRVNIAWFIGTGKTRFLRVRLTHLKLIVLSAVLLLVWAVGAGYTAYYQWDKSTQLQLALNDALATVFDYQSKHDEIYETAYKSSPLSKTRAVASVPPSRTRKLLAVPELVSTHKNWQLRLQRPLFTATAGEFSLQFQLKNTSLAVARGHIWAVARIEKNDGQVVFLPLPAGTKVDKKTGTPTTIVNSLKYKIKNQKTETLTFTLPERSAGKIRAITLGLVNANVKGRKASYTVPIDAPFVSDRQMTVSRSERSASQP